MSAPAKFRKKPVVIAAMQWDGTDEQAVEVVEWTAYIASFDPKTAGPGDSGLLEIDTSAGTMTASPGDWIIRGVKGEIYPCKPDIFEATYETMEDA